MSGGPVVRPYGDSTGDGMVQCPARRLAATRPRSIGPSGPARSYAVTEASSSPAR